MTAVAMAARQGTPEWLAARRLGIGSSDAPVITGDAPWGDLLTLYAAKSGIIDEPDIENQQTAWGKKLEAVVAAWFEEESAVYFGAPKKLRAVNRLLRHPKHDWMLASLDRAVVGERALCEIKTRRFPTDEWGPAMSSQIPAHYIVQVQHQLAVTGYDVAYVAVLFTGSDPRPYVIPRDDDMIEGLIELEALFMEAVRTQQPPEPLIRSAKPLVTLQEGEITADETLALGIEGVFLARQEIKQLKAELAEAENAVKTLLDPYTAARAGAYRATYKPIADSHPVRWDLVAAAYRKAAEDSVDDPDMLAELRAEHDRIESLFTDLKAGNRPLLIRRVEEAADAA